MTALPSPPLFLYAGRRLDLETADAFRDRWGTLQIDPDTEVQVDLRDTAFLDVAGLAALVKLLVHCRVSNGIVTLVGPIAPPVLELLDFSGFLPLFRRDTRRP